jgi:peptidoglycan/xylan/chitin deacetylase (PgdA/CDA1 family)
MKKNIKHKKIITLSYDDGRLEDKKLVALLNKYNLKATFHINSGNLGRDNFVKDNEIVSLYEGHEVSAHTVTHPKLYWKNKSFIKSEILEDVKKLSSLCGYQVRGMSFPFGDNNKRIRTIVKNLCLDYARTVKNNKKFSFPKNTLKWHPNCHDKNGMKTAQRFFSDSSAKLLYIWGHSYEFTEQNRWDEFEELCNYISNRNDVWYATNIEVIDYINSIKKEKGVTNYE